MDAYQKWRVGLFAMWIMLSISALATIIAFLIVLLLRVSHA
jgi:hypothetical protein